MRTTTIATLLATVILNASSFGQLVFPDGSQQSRAAVAFDRVIPVDADGTDTQNGTALLNTVAGITTASISNQFQIVLDLGTYDLGSGTLTMKPFVHIAGRGIAPDFTVITSSGAVTVDAADSAVLKDLRVENSGNNSVVIRANGVDPWFMSGIKFEHLGTAGGVNTIVSVENGANLNLIFCSMGIEVDNAGGTSKGVIVSGGSLFIAEEGCSIEVRDPTGGVSVNLEIGGSDTAEISKSLVATVDGPPDIAIQVASGGLCELNYTVVEGATALTGSGTIVANHSQFAGLRTGATNATYTVCSDFGVGKAIIDTNGSTP